MSQDLLTMCAGLMAMRDQPRELKPCGLCRADDLCFWHRPWPVVTAPIQPTELPWDYEESEEPL